jgi:bis(5'-adenosyl)-triphosphatase
LSTTSRRRHVESVLSLSSEELDAVMVLARDVTPLLLSVFNSRTFDWTLQDGEAAGQTIPHVHFHVIPRVEGDLESPGDWYPALELARQRKWRDVRTGSANRPKSDPADTRLIVDKLRDAARQRGLLE